jgi:hypothetical protein
MDKNALEDVMKYGNSDVTFIRRHLVINNLHLGTKVIWSEEKQDYFMGE